MLSRVAENLYWMTRYMERAEDTARLINAVTLMTLDMPKGGGFGWDTLIKIAGQDDLFFEHYKEANESSVMRFLIHDEFNPSSILTCIVNARENTRTFREVLPWESWEWVNELYLYAKRAFPLPQDRRNRYDVLQEIIRRRQSIIGLLSGSMSVGTTASFLAIGRNLERADMTSRILDVSHTIILPQETQDVEGAADLIWTNILKALSAYQMYRRHVSVHAASAKVIDFLLKDTMFPRSVTYCIRQIAGSLSDLPGPRPVLAETEAARKLVFARSGDGLDKEGLHQLVDEIQISLMRIDRALHEQYFSLATPSRKLAAGEAPRQEAQ